MNCSVPTLGCIREGKAAAVALAQAKDKIYWSKVREEAAEVKKLKLEQEAYESSLAVAFTKAEKYDMLMQNPPAQTVNYIINNNEYNTIINIAPPSARTHTPVGAKMSPDRFTIGEDLALINDEFSTAFKIAFYISLFFLLAILIGIPALLFWCLLRCCCRRKAPKTETRKQKEAPKEEPRTMASSHTQTSPIASPTHQQENTPRIPTPSPPPPSTPGVFAPDVRMSKRKTAHPRRRLQAPSRPPPATSSFSALLGEARNPVERQPGE